MLKKKLLRDLNKNKSQFITIFLMVFLGVFVFSGIHAYMDGMKDSGNDYYEKNNLQDLWIVGKNFTEEDLKTVKEIDNIKDAERILTINTALQDFKDVTIEANFIESNNISKMAIIDGEKFESNKKGIWLDSYLAKNLDIKVGDKITIKYQNYEIEEEVKGLINTPDHAYSTESENVIFPTHKNFGYAYLSASEIPEDLVYDTLKNKTGIKDIKLIKSNIKDFDISDYCIFNGIIVDVDDTEKLEETKSNIENKITSALAVTDRESSRSYAVYNSEIKEGNTYSSVFTILFLFIAILSVITTMNRFVKKQRTQIGTLKALGYSDKKITLHYISFGFFVSLIASILGMVIGRYTLGIFFLNMEMSYFEVPTYHTLLLPIVYILAIVVVLIITLVTYLSCKNILKEPASESLRLQMPKVKNTKFNITSNGIFKNSSISTKWNLRDIARNKGRSIMAIVGIVGSCMLVVCALGMLNTMNGYLDWEFDKINNFEYKITLDSNYSEDDFNSLTDKYGNATSMTKGIEFKLDDKKESNIITVNDANDYLKYTDHNRKYIELKTNGIYVTEKMSEKYNLKIGDKLNWHIFGDSNWYESEIVGFNRDPQSQQINTTREYYESLDLTYKADSIYTNKDLSSVKTLDGVDIIQDIDTLKLEMQSMLNAMKSMVVLLIAVAIILGFVIIYNLGILSFSEKQYQFATLKVLGFKDNQIKKIFIKQNIWLTIIAIIIGLPLGYYMTDFIFKSALGENYDFNATIERISYIYSAVGTFAISYLINKFLSKKVNEIDMVTSLKGNE